MVVEAQLKRPPQNAEAEACVLGSVLLDNDAIGVVSEIVSPADFYEHNYRIIFETILALFEENRSVDAVTVKDRLTSKSQLEEVGGVQTLVQLLESVPSAAHAGDYANIVRDKAMKRRLISVGNEVVREAYQSEEAAEKLIEFVESEVFNIAENRTGDEPQEMAKILPATVKMIEDLHRQKGRLTGCGTDYYELDEKTNGFQPGDFIVLAARPSVGKTTFALNCAVNMALRHKKAVAFFSLEMSREQIVANMLCSASRVKSHHIRKGTMSESDFAKLVEAGSLLYEAPIYIDDNAGLSPTSLRGKARRLKRRFGIDCIIIDYLQLMDAPRADNRQQEISVISRGIKALARELRVPIIALSQINRAAEKEERKPRMSDLRESGAIEQDADLVMFLWRPDYQKTDEPEPPPGEGRKTELILAKQRNGPTGKIDLLFYPEYMRFENPAHGSVM